MSKIGKLPINLPAGVEAQLTENIIIVSGPKGKLQMVVPRNVKVENKENTLYLTLKKNFSSASAIYGTTRALIANMVVGVSVGWKKELELVGAGYKAEVSGKDLILNVGFSHPVKIVSPETIALKVEKNMITVEGTDKEIVGQMASKIRAVNPPEPYKGKGIKYKDEVIRRKAGKAAKVAGAPG